MVEQESSAGAMSLGRGNEIDEPDPPDGANTLCSDKLTDEQELPTSAMTLASANETDEQDSAAVPAHSVSQEDEISGDDPIADEQDDQHNGRQVPTRRVLIDTNMLFTEIEKYPDLYLKDFNEYVSKIEKRRQWEQICESLYPQAKMLASENRKRLIKKIRKKWTTLRYNFFERRRGEKQIRERIYDHRNCCPRGEIFEHAAGVVNYFQDGHQCVKRRQFAGGMALVPEVPRVGVLPEEPQPIPSTSTPFDFPPQSPSTCADMTNTASPNYNQLLTVIYAELLTLDDAQLAAIAPKILRNISEVKEKSKTSIKILQTELLGGQPLEMPIGVLQTFEEQELTGEETFSEQEPIAVPGPVSEDPCAAVEPAAEETGVAPGEEEEEIYPSSYGRPKNDKGEIIYPETDPEDFDD